MNKNISINQTINYFIILTKEHYKILDKIFDLEELGPQGAWDVIISYYQLRPDYDAAINDKHDFTNESIELIKQIFCADRGGGSSEIWLRQPDKIVNKKPFIILDYTKCDYISFIAWSVSMMVDGARNDYDYMNPCIERISDLIVQ